LLYGGLALQQDQEILTTTHDHYSTDVSLRLRAERTGATVRRISLYEELSTISRESLVKKLVGQVRVHTRIVAVTWVHSSTGLKLPIAEMAKALENINASRAEKDRIIFCVDGVHALGVEDFRLSDLGCDFFVAGTHMNGPGPSPTP
jgi:selenocysteine lyase/cysteine desulfurase